MTAPELLTFHSGPGEAAWNMAVDDALLVTAAARNAQVLRFYGWTEPAATFGYFQRHLEVEARTPLRPLIRRPTGGGIVPHDRDWTYSLTIPPGHAWHRIKAVESYRTIHEWVIRGLQAVGIPAELAPCCRKEIPGACFEGYEQFDVLAYGKKIAGAAQRRNASGLLIQGSVQPPSQAERPAWESAMITQPPTEHFSGSGVFRPDPSFLEMAEALVRTKYAQPDYNHLR
jgi:lipoate-protein ligase A